MFLLPDWLPNPPAKWLKRQGIHSLKPNNIAFAKKPSPTINFHRVSTVDGSEILLTTWDGAKTRRIYWDTLPTSTGARRISEPSTLSPPIALDVVATKIRENTTFNFNSGKKTLLQGSLYYQPKHCTQNHHTFALFDPPQNG